MSKIAQKDATKMDWHVNWASKRPWGILGISAMLLAVVVGGTAAASHAITKHYLGWSSLTGMPGLLSLWAILYVARIQILKSINYRTGSSPGLSELIKEASWKQLLIYALWVSLTYFLSVNFMEWLTGDKDNLGPFIYLVVAFALLNEYIGFLLAKGQP